MTMFRSVILAAALQFAVKASLAASPPTVFTAGGTIRGGICANVSDAVYFKSIPFAKPPTGDLRFAPPQPYEAFPNLELDATKPAPSCIQFDPQNAEKGTTSEDCLYLNVWAPASATNTSALPVRVWIYGGSNTAGGISNPTYDGCNVPRTDALMVSINYRLGPLGFLTAEGAGIRGNQAIQDILLGLDWVQKNIAAFGGDPKKVMLHGQSAGADNAFVVATLPQALKLMSAAILESGGGRDSQAKSSAERLGDAFSEALNCSSTDAACLRRVSTQSLQEVQSSLPLLNDQTYPVIGVRNYTSMSFHAHVDGIVIQEQPSTKGVRVPSVFGSTELEGTIFVLGQFAASSPSNPALAVNASVYHTFLEENFGSSNAKLIEKFFPVSAFDSTPFPAYYAVVMANTLANYECSAYRGLNTAVANGVPVWAYRFNHTPKCAWYSSLPKEAFRLLGPTHTSEIPFMLGATEQLPLPDGNCSMTSDERSISDFMNKAWTMMASDQKPTAHQDDWPAYTGPDQSRGLQIVNSTSPGYINYTRCELYDKITAGLLAAAGSNGTGNGTSPAAGSSPSSDSSPASSDTSALGAQIGHAHVLLTLATILFVSFLV